jgi:uncharacterized protein YdeI (YjbR/CyaY-like superfamily)
MVRMIDETTLQPPYPLVEPANREEWRAWLLANHVDSPGIWLVYHRPAAGEVTLDYEAAVEEALCFGWIDSKTGKVDAERTRQVFTPRRPGSPWSRPNKQRIERMLAQGKMHASGLARIEAAKRDGSWELYDAIEELRLPPDLSAAFDTAPEAAAGFERFSPSTRKQLLWWLVSAKRPETRSRRVEAIVASAAVGKNPLAQR